MFSLIWPRLLLRELVLGLLCSAACVAGHLPDLPAVVVEAGTFGLSGDPGKHLGFTGRERGALSWIVGEAVGAVGGSAAAHLGDVVQEFGDVAGGDPVSMTRASWGRTRGQRTAIASC